MSGSSKHSALGWLQERVGGGSRAGQFSPLFNSSAHFLLILDNQMFNNTVTPNSLSPGLTLCPLGKLHTTVETHLTQGLVTKTSIRGDNCL